MDLRTLCTPEARSFIHSHQNDDIHQLMLSAGRWPDLPVKALVEQIQSRKKAKLKLPDWYANQEILFPPSSNLEQASSQATALYKARLFQGKSLLDLTGGTGIDSYYFSQRLDQITYVEPNQDLVDLAHHNFGELGAGNILIIHNSAEEFLAQDSKQYDLIYIDPSRRKDGSRIFKLEDCQPDVLQLLPELLNRTDRVVIKVSPLLDVSRALDQLGSVSQLWVVSVKNDCKELLFEVTKRPASPLIHTVNLSQREEHFSFELSEEADAQPSYSEPSAFLYEPNASILKSGAFKTTALRFGLNKLHPNTHLYTSDSAKEDFPGRLLKVIEWDEFSWKALARWKNLKVNVVTRNFPHSVDEIRKKAQLKEGGEEFLYFTRTVEDKLVFILGSKGLT